MSKSMRSLPIFVTTALLLSATAYAIPVIPGASGFGIDTPAGRSGRIFRVTNLHASGSGSLEECVAASGPRICVFETSGAIRLTSNLRVRNPYLTIAGQTAPAPGIMIRGAGITINTSNVLVQHISVRPGDDVEGPPLDSRDALQINAIDGDSLTNVVIDHCSFGWSIDETLDVWSGWDNVTLSNNIFAEPLKESLHPKGSHDYAALVGASSGRIAFIGNLFAHATDRNPRVGAAQFAFVNNVVYNYGQTGTFLFSENRITLSSIVGNLYIKGPSSNENASTIRIDSVAGKLLPNGSKVFLENNVGDRPDGSRGTGDPWSIVNNGSGLSRSALEAVSPPAWPAGLVARSTGNDEVLTDVLGNAGSRPAERSSVDARIIGHVEHRTGRSVNCVANDGSSRCAANAGGWPSYSENRRAPNLPADPNGDEDGDGYTNLEEWLHEMAAAVEGGTRASAQTKPNPPSISVD